MTTAATATTSLAKLLLPTDVQRQRHTSYGEVSVFGGGGDEAGAATEKKTSVGSLRSRGGPSRGTCGTLSHNRRRRLSTWSISQKKLSCSEVVYANTYRLGPPDDYNDDGLPNDVVIRSAVGEVVAHYMPVSTTIDKAISTTPSPSMIGGWDIDYGGSAGKRACEVANAVRVRLRQSAVMTTGLRRYKWVVHVVVVTVPEAASVCFASGALIGPDAGDTSVEYIARDSQTLIAVSVYALYCE